MSECVVRMDMPESCAKCRAWSICPVLDGYMSVGCYEWSFEDVLNMTDDEGFTKPEDCPIICQLPEGHGRLIDANEFLKRAIGTKCFDEDDSRMLHELVGESITIVPAERSEK